VHHRQRDPDAGQAAADDEGDQAGQRRTLLSAVLPLSQTAGPVVSVPGGRDGTLPFGVQLAGRRGDEAALLQLAATLARHQ
jgi:Asp-tRNA(Asn)/Glu-tRNA(Gln) amidotransferase A subunit family amidase